MIAMFPSPETCQGDSISCDPRPIAEESINVVNSIDLKQEASIFLGPHHDSLTEILSPLLLVNKGNSFNFDGNEKILHSPGKVPSSCLLSKSSHPLSFLPSAITPLQVERNRAPFCSKRDYCRPDQWLERYSGLVKFQKKYGHCRVPRNWSEDRLLAMWVKRQRYQYRLKQSGMHSTLTDRREMMLNRIQFVWDSHESTWERRFNELKKFVEENGHCKIPTTLDGYRQLATWVRSQRRQYKRYCNGNDSCMPLERILKLTSVGFDWRLWKELYISILAINFVIFRLYQIQLNFKLNEKF